VSALLDAAKADNSVVEALAAKGNPALLERDAAALARSILEVLEARGVLIGDTQGQEITGCKDLEQLRLWLRRAAVASSSDEITSDS
jgi:hypothetical protein